MDLGIDGKVALVTGASQGIGAAIARRLDREGCRLVLVARDEEKLRKAKQELNGPHSTEALVLSCDVTSAEQVSGAVGIALERFGAIDILVNNAGGLSTGGPLPFDALSDGNFIATYDLNVLSAVRFIHGVLPSMRRKGWGRIVNITSESAVQPDAGAADYAAAKAALNAISKSLSKAYAAEGVLTNAVSPAFTMTPLLAGYVEQQARVEGKSFAEVEAALLQAHRPNIALKRPGKPEETAAAVAFLVSDLASFVNGASLRVDGGSVASVAN